MRDPSAGSVRAVTGGDGTYRDAVLTALGDLFADVEGAAEAPPGLAQKPPSVIAEALVNVASAMRHLLTTAGMGSVDDLVGEVGALSGEREPVLEILALMAQDEGATGAPRTTAALLAGDTDVDSILFVLLTLLVMAALVTDRSVVGFIEDLRDGDAPTPGAAYIDVTPAAIMTALVIPALVRRTDTEIGRVVPPAAESGSVTGFPGDQEFENALRSHLGRETAERSLREEVAGRCGVPMGDVLVDRICALA
ncbi:MAG: hypothetical protein NVS3B21_29590 [Acidimicrobiales bacterium]